MSYPPPPGGPGPAAGSGYPQGQLPHMPVHYPSPTPPPDGASGSGFKKLVVVAVVLAALSLLGLGGVAGVNALVEQPLPNAQGAGEGGGKPLMGDREISALLGDRTKALHGGDEDAYLAAFSDDVKKKQRKVFKNLRKVPFTKAEYAALQVTGAGSDSYGDGVSLALDVAFVHQIKDVDVAPVAEWYRWIVTRESENSDPVVTKVSGSPNAWGKEEFVFYPGPWDVYDDMYVKRQKHSITIADNKNSETVSRYTPYIEKSAQDDLTAWKAKAPQGVKTPQSFVVVVEPDRKTYNRMYTSTVDDTAWEAGMSVPMPAYTKNREQDGGQYGGARIKMYGSADYFEPKRWKDGVPLISRHEMAHALLEPLDNGETTIGTALTGEGAPRTWLVEGFADYMSMRDRPAERQARIRARLSGKSFDGKLPASGPEFESQRDVSANYTLSHLVVEFIAKKAGEDGMFAFAVQHYQHPRQLNAQLQKTLGMSPAEFEKEWASYVRSVVK